MFIIDNISEEKMTNTENIIIREITVSDKEEYIAMAEEFYSSDAVSHQIPKENFKKAFDAATNKNPFIKLYILESNGETAGYAAIAATFTTEGGGNTLWLDELYIRPEHRGKGLGHKLIKFLKKDESVKRIRLEITPGNKRAEKLYISEGFVPCDYRQLIFDTKF